MLENMIRIFGLIAMTIGTTVAFTFYSVQPTLAQNTQQQLETLRIGQAQTEVRMAEIPARLGSIEMRVSSTESSIAKIYGFGGGLGSLLVVLQVLQMLGARRTPAA